MRCFASVSLVLILLVPAAGALAAPVGGLSYNVGSPGFSIGSGVGFSQRDVHVIKDDKVVDEAGSSRWLVKVDVGPIDYLDLYGLVGAADFRLSDTPFRGTLATCYGGGVRPQLLPLGLFRTDLRVSADLQYFAFTTSDEVGGRDIEARYQEFQAALIVAYKLPGIVPYGGLKYDPVNIDMTGTHNDLQGDMDAGVFVGTDYFVTPTVFFNAELSIFAETSIFLMVGYGYPTQH